MNLREINLYVGVLCMTRTDTIFIPQKLILELESVPIVIDSLIVNHSISGLNLYHSDMDVMIVGPDKIWDILGISRHSNGTNVDKSL